MFALHNTRPQPVYAKANALQRDRQFASTSARTARHVVARNDSQNSRNAETGSEMAPQEGATSTTSTMSTTSAASSAEGSRLQTPEKEGFVKGQGTAIVTGAISIIFGVAYLALVSLLDVRGGELQPPPPEAFLQ